MKKVFATIIVFIPLILSAQLFDGEEYEYNTEIIWGINKNTNGGLIGGLMFRYSRSKGDDFFETFGLELSNVKHPSESKYVGIQGQSFIYGKSNYLYAIRLQYGREKLLFKKATQQGVQISAGASVGPTLGFVNPYYVLETGGDYERFDPLRHPSPETIAGPGKLFQGLGQSDIVPGINLKGAASFEFGTYRSNVAGVEVGMMVETYTKEIVLVPTQSNRSTFTSVFFTLFWGTRK
ncbi:MAG: hypothetical protein RIM99_01630 [Cyclobacteriaceae bacterium]